MDVRPDKLPDDVVELKRIIQRQQAVIDRKQKALEQRQRKIDGHLETISRKQTLIERLEAQLRWLQQRRFGKSSEKHLGQIELQLFTEAELLDLQAMLDEATPATVTVPAHTRQRSKSRALPQNLQAPSSPRW